MTDVWGGRQQELEARLVAQLSEAGYSVVRDPREDQLPFTLAGYRPDLIAYGDNGGLIVELKRSERRLTVDRFVEIARLVRKQPGWRFMLIPLDRLEQSLPLLLRIPTRRELQERLEMALYLLKGGGYAPAFLTAWSGLEGHLRARAEEQAIPVSSLSPLPLIKHLYSQGVLSLEQMRQLEDLMKNRNAVIHGFEDPQIGEAASRCVALLEDFLKEPTPKPQAI